MTDIVVLSLKADETVARTIVDAMVEHRLDVWWEQLDPTDAASVIAARRQVNDARAVLLVWSGHCLDSGAAPFVRVAEAARRQAKAICVRIDAFDLPSSMAGCSTYSLHGWRASPGPIRRFFGGGLYLRDVVAAAQFKLAGRDPPPPSAPRNMLLRQLLVVIPSLFAIIALVPTLIGLWTDLGWSNRPSREEQAAWQRLDGSCSGLRGFLSRHPDGHYAAQAQARLAGRRTTMRREWEPAERTLPVGVSLVDAPVAPTETAARARSSAHAVEAARAGCARLAEVGAARLTRVTLRDGSLRCEPVEGDIQCTYDGAAVCSLAEPRDVPIEAC